MLLNMFTPAVSHAIATLAGKPAWAQICSAAGLRAAPPAPRLQASTSDSAVTPEMAAAHHIKHCVLCASFHPSMPPPAAIALPYTPAIAAASFALPPDSVPLSPPVWPPSQPRGPPALA